MSEDPGTAPEEQGRHFLNEVTKSKLTDYLDAAREFDIEVVTVQYIGDRHWAIITFGAPIPGPAGRRIFH